MRILISKLLFLLPIGFILNNSSNRPERLKINPKLRQHSRNKKNSREDDFGIKLPIETF